MRALSLVPICDAIHCIQNINALVFSGRYSSQPSRYPELPSQDGINPEPIAPGYGIHPITHQNAGYESFPQDPAIGGHHPYAHSSHSHGMPYASDRDRLDTLSK